MSASVEEEKRPDLCELFGAAVNASSLVVDPRSERALDRVAAMGMAAAAMARGRVDRQQVAPGHQVGIPAEEGKRDERHLVAELAPVLWHLKYGRQVGVQTYAAALFAEWMLIRRKFSEDERGIAEVFARRLVHEWLHERCASCRGSGKLERVAGSLIAPRGRGVRNASFALCTTCRGSGRAFPNHHVRARLLDLPMDWYEEQRWSQRFIAGLAWLDAIARRLYGRLHSKLRRSTLHAE